MKNLNIIDYLFLYSLICIWFVLLLNILLTISGYIFFSKLGNRNPNLLKDMKRFPLVSIIIPAHNEEKVIEETVKAMLSLDYPHDKLEIIVVNDNSNDDTANILNSLQDQYSNRNLKIIETTKKDGGGKGKSNALNIGYKASRGEYLVIYDSDNTPEPLALRYLVWKIESSKEFGAVIGKFRTRNKDKNLLTRFINIETLSFQWIAQAGRWNLFKLCTIPGTNFIVRKDVIKKLGGWDVEAIAEDTEISFRIYRLGYKIGFMPWAVTWEQEPETIGVWMKQRNRWVSGNIYVLFKYFFRIRKEKSKSFIFDLYYFFSVYILFLSSIIISDGIFILGLFTDIKISLAGNFWLFWILAYILFILEVSICLTLEKGESNWKNIFLVAIMYFTYAQMWIVVAVKGIASYLKNLILKKEINWYKTERF